MAGAKRVPMLKIASFLDLSFAKAVVSVEAPRFRDPAEALRSQCHPFSAFHRKLLQRVGSLARTEIPRGWGKKGKTQDQTPFPSRFFPLLVRFLGGPLFIRFFCRKKEKKSRFSKEVRAWMTPTLFLVSDRSCQGCHDQRTLLGSYSMVLAVVSIPHGKKLRGTSRVRT